MKTFREIIKMLDEAKKNPEVAKLKKLIDHHSDQEYTFAARSYGDDIGIGDDGRSMLIQARAHREQFQKLQKQYKKLTGKYYPAFPYEVSTDELERIKITPAQKRAYERDLKWNKLGDDDGFWSDESPVNPDEMYNKDWLADHGGPRRSETQKAKPKPKAKPAAPAKKKKRLEPMAGMETRSVDSKGRTAEQRKAPDSDKKAGSTWQTASRNWGGKNREGELRYFKDRKQAQQWARG